MAKSEKQSSIHTRTNRIFLLGVTTLLPSVLTVLIIYKAYIFIDSSLATPINKRLVDLIAFLKGIPVQEVDNPPAWIGFILAFSIFFFAGLLFAGFIGRRLFQIMESWLSNLPVIKAVYPHAKQIVDFFTSKKRPQVSGVVVVQYPREGVYSLGFVTGEGLKDITNAAGEELINVFIPSSPTPVSGYAIFLPRKDVFPIDMSVDQVLRYSISAGVLIPEHQKRL